MDLLIIVLLVVLTIFLVVVEALLIPGISVALIGAIISGSVATGMAFTTYGTGAAFIVFLCALVLSLIALVLSMRKRNLSKISLKTKVSSTVGEKVSVKVAVGSRGESVTRLAPIGHVNIDNSSYEAKSVDGFIDPKTAIEVVGYEDNMLVVKRLK